VEDTEDSSGKTVAVPLNLIASDSGYRIRCAKLPALSTLSILMAVAEIHWDDPALKGASIWSDAYVMKVPCKCGGTHWYGHQIEDSLFEPVRPTVKNVSIEGEYTAVQRIRKLSGDVKVYDMMGPYRRQIAPH
jgi:hypothetical protein